MAKVSPGCPDLEVRLKTEPGVKFSGWDFSSWQMSLGIRIRKRQQPWIRGASHQSLLSQSFPFLGFFGFNFCMN